MFLESINFFNIIEVKSLFKGVNKTQFIERKKEVELIFEEENIYFKNWIIKRFKIIKLLLLVVLATFLTSREVVAEFASNLPSFIGLIVMIASKVSIMGFYLTLLLIATIIFNLLFNYLSKGLNRYFVLNHIKYLAIDFE